MDLLFVYQDRIAQDAEGNYYTGSAFSQEVFDRYLQYFDHITLLMRKANIDPRDEAALSQMNRIDTSHIDIVFLPDMFSGIRNYLNGSLRREFRNTVISNIVPGRAVIIRAPSTSGTIAADYCYAHGIPYLAEAVGCPWDSLWNHSLKGKLLAPGARRNFGRVMKNASYAVYVTSEFLQKRYPTDGKSAAISDVELQPVNDKVLKSRFEKIMNHKGIYRIGTAGALHVGYKGQKYVIKALAALKAKGLGDFEYHLAGGGDPSILMRLAEKLGVSDKVVLDGAIPHDEMFAWYDTLDVYIQPSETEGLPRALIEAMSRGLPAFGSQVGGIPELLHEEDLFSAGDIKRITALLSAISEAGLQRRAERNFECAKQFQKEVLEQKRNEFYSAFANEARSNNQ